MSDKNPASDCFDVSASIVSALLFCSTPAQGVLQEQQEGKLFGMVQVLGTSLSALAVGTNYLRK